MLAGSTSRRATASRQRFPLDALSLDEAAEEPLYRQLEDQLRDAIWTGRLLPGERLPSTRSLAQDLGVARNTAINAYNQLILEGYLVTAKGSGTRVAADLPERLLRAPGAGPAATRETRPLPFTRNARRIASFRPWVEAGGDLPSRPFRPHVSAIDAFPRALWEQLTARRLRSMSRALLERTDPRGYRPLREAIAGYLGSARGLVCGPDQVIVTGGAQRTTELIATLLLEPGDTVCLEDPGYTLAGFLFELAGARVVSLPVDDEGLDVARLSAQVPEAKLVYVTPSSQFPLGMTMTLPRRLALIDWAERCGAVIVEDDYNGEYRYAGRPLPALSGLAPQGRVLYTGSFSKLLFPALRLGYIVVPPDAVEHFAAARWLLDRHAPPLEQAVLADFIDEGHFARHVRRMRTLYAERQGVLVEAAARDLAGFMDVPPSESGLHLIGWLKGGLTGDRVAEAAASAGLEVVPTSMFAAGRLERDSVILGYAPFTPRQIRRATQDLAHALARR